MDLSERRSDSAPRDSASGAPPDTGSGAPPDSDSASLDSAAAPSRESAEARLRDRPAGLASGASRDPVAGPASGAAGEPVLLVSIDGVAPRFVTPEGMPSLCGLLRQGAGCFAARTVTPPWTRVAHASLLRGADPTVHGLTDNSAEPVPEGPPSVLAVARAAGLSTAAANCWRQLDSLIEPDALTHRLFVDAGYDPADDRLGVEQLSLLYSRSAPDVTFAYLAAPDLAGHDHGWGSAAYLDALTSADADLGMLLRSAGPGTAVVVTTDHGGAGSNHDLGGLDDGGSADDVLDTFVVARSKRLAPGSMWTAASILDVAPTVADLAGIAPHPCWSGSSLIGREQPMAEHLMSMLESLAEHSYGENLSMLAHVLQTAAHVQAACPASGDGGSQSAALSASQADAAARGDDELVVAALLHDIGHLLGETGTHGRADHAELGAAFLRPWLPATVVEPIRLHVAAKRHMVAADPAYGERLSDASRITLQQQGGPFDAAGSERFGAEAHAGRAMLLRVCDDLGKQPGSPTAGLDEYRLGIEAALAAGPIDPALARSACRCCECRDLHSGQSLLDSADLLGWTVLGSRRRGPETEIDLERCGARHIAVVANELLPRQFPESSRSPESASPPTSTSAESPGSPASSGSAESPGSVASSALPQSPGSPAPSGSAESPWAASSSARSRLAEAWPPEHSPIARRPGEVAAIAGDVARFGLALVAGLPAADGEVLRFAQTLGHVRETNYGRLFDVRSEPRAANLAYTPLGLALHTDNPYRDPAPSVQVLLCLRRADSGGATRLADGLAAAERLRRQDPEAFERLASTTLEFRYRDDGVDLAAERTVLELRPDGSVRSVAFNDRSLDTPCDSATARALGAFAEMLEERSLELVLSPGEAIVFDNRRILHARTAFDPASGRHLQGCYIDIDSVHSIARTGTAPPAG